MKKDLCIILIVGLIFLVAGSQVPGPTQELGEKYTEAVNAVEGFTAEIVEDSVTRTSLRLTLTNETDCTYLGNRNHFFVQKKVDGEWYWLKCPEDVVFSAVAHLFEKGTSYEIAVEWKGLHGKLTPGHYRMVQEFSDDVPGSQVIYPLAAEFMIE